MFYTLALFYAAKEGDKVTAGESIIARSSTETTKIKLLIQILLPNRLEFWLLYSFCIFEEFNIAVICVLMLGVCDVLDGLFSGF